MMQRNVVRSKKFILSKRFPKVSTAGGMWSCAVFNKTERSGAASTTAVLIKEESLDEGCVGPSLHSKAPWAPR